MSAIERPGIEPGSDLLELAYPYAIDAVTDGEREEIELRRAHADRLTAAEFDAIVAWVRETMADLSIADSCSPPADLEDRLMRALDRVTVPPPAETARRRTQPHRWYWLTAAAVVIVAIGMGLGFTVFRSAERPAADVLSAALIDRQPDMTARVVPVSSGGELEIHTSATLSAASVRFLAVPEPPAGHTYQMWLVPLGGTPRSTAVLDTIVGDPLVMPFQSVDTLAVTVEPLGGSPQPTTTPIVSLNLVT
ncbi:anti-sigma factor [Nocardia sp. NBC_01503]|uniref:anti-sigma factor n=1 Tax=Nocardia sp. NBC_01503 TaxID=2975997 RepID=UPI002E7B599A|nr:anti-sigma factor [Nocardia sp. NBC_01503]WTL30619.1 anti-sigma factor [Nocardia sp. NBC_01503]